AEDLIRVARRVAGSIMNVGAGTVCTTKDLDLALEAGAEFIVTPIVAPEVVDACRRARVPVIPGAFTPSEIFRAWERGGALVKAFPREPRGAVTVETLAEYKSAGAEGFGVGSPLFHKERVAARDWKWVEEQARRFAEAFRRA